MLDVSRLNDHSRTFAQQLFREFPDWLRYARFDPYEEFEPEALLVEVPRPVGDGRNGLFITTSEWEVSVGFGENFHARFGVNGQPGEDDFRRRALDFIREFVAESLVLVTASEGDQWLGAWTVRVENGSVPPQDKEAGVTLRIRSWKGTWDRDVP
ncbi:MAG TPA: hypothetical protein PLL30_04495 [Candidatus Krumholzibacteria bacterium]|nr:hypothetical protein [Candidatus Krumholzibacteria bacterium]HPD71029.1 hypothetical protein [Candidatus Krumholzibacteria bacterium]HRY39271.1 hypothetical protein [Candidatus Krumholzibacteria bacterium]